MGDTKNPVDQAQKKIIPEKWTPEDQDALIGATNEKRVEMGRSKKTIFYKDVKAVNGKSEEKVLLDGTPELNDQIRLEAIMALRSGDTSKGTNTNVRSYVSVNVQ